MEDAKAVKQSEMLAELEIADGSVNSLLDTIGRLVSVLSPVMHTESPHPKEDEEQPSLVDRAEKIRAIRLLIDSATNRISNIIGLLEV